MINVLLTVGKAKADYAALGLEEYARRLQGAGGCLLEAVRPVKGRPDKEVKAMEGQRLLAALNKRDLVWALDGAGRSWSSEQWAGQLKEAQSQGWQRLVLMVGGPLGLSSEALRRAQERVSLGPITLPHELAALVALEQLYRAHSILAGSPYHRP